jgi:phosphoglycolate phosphatase
VTSISPPPNQIRCVLFDLDNTLIGIPNTWAYFDNIIEIVLTEKFSVAVPPQEERDLLWRSGKEYVEILTRWGVNPKNFWAYFDEVDAIRRKELFYQKKLILFPDAIPTLQQLKEKGYKLGIVSNSPSFLVNFEVKAFNLDRFFDIYLGLGETQDICKPEPDGLLSVINQLNMTPVETIYVGDSSIDLIAAKRAKITPVLIDRTGKKVIRDSDIGSNEFGRITTLDQILQIV